MVLMSLEKAESLNPDRPDIYYNKGNILKDLDVNDRAIAAYEKASGFGSVEKTSPAPLSL